MEILRASWATIASRVFPDLKGRTWQHVLLVFPKVLRLRYTMLVLLARTVFSGLRTCADRVRCGRRRGRDRGGHAIVKTSKLAPLGVMRPFCGSGATNQTRSPPQGFIVTVSSPGLSPHQWQSRGLSAPLNACRISDTRGEYCLMPIDRDSSCKPVFI